MDFDKLLSGYRSKACVMSVDILPDDRYGNIRIVAGNKPHYDDMMATMHKEFVPGSPYAEYFPENKNFEDFCYRSAVLGQPLPGIYAPDGIRPRHCQEARPHRRNHKVF